MTQPVNSRHENTSPCIDPFEDFTISLAKCKDKNGSNLLELLEKSVTVLYANGQGASQKKIIATTKSINPELVPVVKDIIHHIILKDSALL
ncbi:MAG: hypothetical protein COT84_04845 [Chlamydiae bacterium CG10_big_fil_rev_8_21_14_0_10_35_9]|nr:MAG: hypothetical protein COT84_04845 [Chlamydiae bacterium CG10_big_fil_rev_8_21_14_0_10_35_9]